MTFSNSELKVLLIGWDAADWKIIHALADAGKMPNMAGFIEEVEKKDHGKDDDGPKEKVFV